MYRLGYASSLFWASFGSRFRNCARIDRTGGLHGCLQPQFLRKRPVPKAVPDAMVALGHLQHVDKALRLAKCIAAFQHLYDGCRPQLQRASDIAMLARSHQRQFAAVVRYL